MGAHQSGRADMRQMCTCKRILLYNLSPNIRLIYGHIELKKLKRNYSLHIVMNTFCKQNNRARGFTLEKRLCWSLFGSPWLAQNGVMSQRFQTSDSGGPRMGENDSYLAGFFFLTTLLLLGTTGPWGSTRGSPRIDSKNGTGAPHVGACGQTMVS